ncbi:MAG: hypothetical protein PVSMB8_01260 [Vulcanimicrobiaceae bacterium]
MIVNMYVDHLMATPPASAEEVWNATRVHSKLFNDAASRIGLSPAEYREFRTALLDGKAAFVRLPRKVDAMSGARHGSVYAVRNAVMSSTIMGWRVALADGNVVYVPQVCANLSMVHPAHVAMKPMARTPRVLGAKHVPSFHPAVASVPKETPVAMEAPPVETPIDVPAAAPTVAQVAPAAIAAGGGTGFLFAIPALIGGIIAGTNHGNTSNNDTAPTPVMIVPPSCSKGSNTVGACFGS